MAQKRKIVAQGVVVEARPHSLTIREGSSPIETTFPLKQNGLEAAPGNSVTIFDDGKFHIGTLPPDWR